MQLTVESVSKNLPFLEAMVFITSQSKVEHIVKPPMFTSQPGDSHPPSTKRLLDFFSPNSRDMLSSYVPNQIAKCVVPTRILAQVTQNHTLELSFLAHFPKTAGVFLALILTLELFFFGVRV